MKCINKLLLFCLLLCSALFTACGNNKIKIPYTADSINSSFSITGVKSGDRADAFASGLCIANENYKEDVVDTSHAEAAGLFCVNDNTTLYAKNVHEKLYPASLTKIMTAVVALKNGNREDLLTASSNVTDLESGAQTCGLAPGDTMTLDQALRILLMHSANDVAIMIAEHYGGTVENFCQMMNEEAVQLGATNCTFRNPNGLTDEEQMVTLYDVYLIFNEASKYELFREIIGMTAYSTVYRDKNGAEKKFDKPSTNQFFNGNYTPPVGITVLGGKTGTTNAAGFCLVLLSSDINGKNYISIILKAEKREYLYEEMTSLLSLAG